MPGSNTSGDHADARSDAVPSPPGTVDSEPAPDDRRTLRAALALTAMVGLVFAALMLRPATGLFSAGGGPLGRSSGWVALLGIGWAIVVGTVSRDYRAAVRHLTGLTPRAERLARVTAWFLPAAAVVLPITALAIVNAQHQSVPSVRLPRVRLQPASRQPATSTDHIAVGNAIAILFGVLILLLAALLGRLAITALRKRRRASRPLLVRSRVLDEQQQLAAAVGSGRQALLGTDARAAVIACYAAMEESLADSGVARHIADSPSELLARAVACDTVPAAAGTALTALFQEARYSRHPMGAPELERARAALDTIARQLGQAAEGVS